MENSNPQISEHFYSKEFDDAVKEPIEYLLFLQWIKELITITKSQNKVLKLFYMDLFYLRLVGLFELISSDNSISKSTDSYTLHVKQYVKDMYEAITDNEYIYLVYCRHSAAHVLQNGYDLFDANGQKRDKAKTLVIRGVTKRLTAEELSRAMNVVILQYGNEEDFAKAILQKLTPYILRLQDGWEERLLPLLHEHGYDNNEFVLKHLLSE